MTTLFDFFDALIVPGFAIWQDIISGQEEAELIRRIERTDLRAFRFQQWTGKRMTRSFGWHYDFEAGSLRRTEPIPAWLALLKERAADCAALDREELIQALLTRYDPGAGIGWHKDRSVFEHVVGISLGHAATLRLRRRDGSGFNRAKAQLAPRSIYQLSGEARNEWEHSIAPMELPRWSITFRSLAVNRLDERSGKIDGTATRRSAKGRAAPDRRGPSGEGL
jgi:alkylated DNA repair protein (DNA oxidative demethylase)